MLEFLEFLELRVLEYAEKVIKKHGFDSILTVFIYARALFWACVVPAANWSQLEF